MTSTSSKPRVVTKAIRAPRRCNSAFVPTVVPWTTSSPSSRAPVSAQMRSSPCRIANEGSEGVEGSLKSVTRPSRSKTKSVKVPPVSTPMRKLELWSLLFGLCILNLLCLFVGKSLLDRYPAPTFIRSAQCVQHELHSIPVFKSRGVFYGCSSGSQDFDDRD